MPTTPDPPPPIFRPAAAQIPSTRPRPTPRCVGRTCSTTSACSALSWTGGGCTTFSRSQASTSPTTSTRAGTGTSRRPSRGRGGGGGVGGGGVPPSPSSGRRRRSLEEPVIDEHDDHIEVNGVVVHKPFVEKPVDADDHNIAIYYPSSAGGGCKKLFRKVGDRSSLFYPEINEIRRDGSYIYESFVETQGTDLKMYTVGPDYGHAEARKSPAIDGKVKRNADGKEVRFPVILTLREKEIARR